MELTPEKIQERIKVTNLFRLASRLKENVSPKDLYTTFEKSLIDNWELLTPTEKRNLEETHSILRQKYLNRVSLEKEQLFGSPHIENPELEFSQADLEKQILNLAKNMKQVAGNFTTALKQDETLLETIHSQQNTYLTQIAKETERMASIQVKTNYFAFFRTFFSVAFSLVLFIIMLIIIHLFPSTNYITI